MKNMMLILFLCTSHVYANNYVEFPNNESWEFSFPSRIQGDESRRLDVPGSVDMEPQFPDNPNSYVQGIHLVDAFILPNIADDLGSYEQRQEEDPRAPLLMNETVENINLFIRHCFQDYEIYEGRDPRRNPAFDEVVSRNPQVSDAAYGFMQRLNSNEFIITWHGRNAGFRHDELGDPRPDERKENLEIIATYLRDKRIADFSPSVLEVAEAYAQAGRHFGRSITFPGYFKSIIALHNINVQALG